MSLMREKRKKNNSSTLENGKNNISRILQNEILGTVHQNFCVLIQFHLNVNLSRVFCYLGLNLTISLKRIYLLLFELNVMVV